MLPLAGHTRHDGKRHRHTVGRACQEAGGGHSGHGEHQQRHHAASAPFIPLLAVIAVMIARRPVGEGGPVVVSLRILFGEDAFHPVDDGLYRPGHSCCGDCHRVAKDAHCLEDAVKIVSLHN